MRVHVLADLTPAAAPPDGWDTAWGHWLRHRTAALSILLDAFGDVAGALADVEAEAADMLARYEGRSPIMVVAPPELRACGVETVPAFPIGYLAAGGRT